MTKSEPDWHALTEEQRAGILNQRILAAESELYERTIVLVELEAEIEAAPSDAHKAASIEQATGHKAEVGRLEARVKALRKLVPAKAKDPDPK